MKLPRNNKKGITLVEVIVGVFVLSIFAVGILSLLIYNNQAVSDSVVMKADYSTAVQKLDMIIAAVSNGADDSFVTYENSKAVGLKKAAIAQLVEMNEDDVSVTPDYYTGTTTIRGWYIELAYSEELTVKGYAANTLGAFDK